MTTILERPATADRLFLWVMHRFSEVFEDHAILKGGMALRLLDCPRATTDIDYVFVPYSSKKAIAATIEKVLREIEGGHVRLSMHSQMLRAELRVDGVGIQIAANVAPTCSSMPIATAHLALAQGQPSRIVRIMSLDVALAHKLAAWNERRLLRDLYDCYYLGSRLGESPNESVIDQRLGSFSSRLPSLRRLKRMSRSAFVAALSEATAGLTQESVDRELAALLPPVELAGLAPRIRAALTRICEKLAEPASH